MKQIGPRAGCSHTGAAWLAIVRADCVCVSSIPLPEVGEGPGRGHFSKAVGMGRTSRKRELFVASGSGASIYSSEPLVVGPKIQMIQSMKQSFQHRYQEPPIV